MNKLNRRDGKNWFHFFATFFNIEKDMIGILLTRLWGMNIKIKSFFFLYSNSTKKKYFLLQKKNWFIKTNSNKSIGYK